MDGVVRTKPDSEADVGSQTSASFDTMPNLYCMKSPMVGHIKQFGAIWLARDTFVGVKSSADDR
jgi:hypothetical protein